MGKIPKNLVYMAKRRLLIPFIGAGFSANCEFPSWKELVERLLTKFHIEHRDILSKHDFLRVAEYIVLKNGGNIGPVRYELQRLLNDENVDISKSDPHLLLVSLNAPILYSTNWDNLIEKAYEHAGREYCKIVILRDLLQAGQTQATQIIKFHGSFEHEETLVLTESHYFQRLELESSLDIKFRSDLLGRSVLFMGYSFTDFNIRYLWFKLQKLMKDIELREVPKSYILLLEHDDVAEELFSRIGIESIVLEDFDGASPVEKLCNFLEDLIIEINKEVYEEEILEGEDGLEFRIPMIATKNFINKSFRAIADNDILTAEKYLSFLCQSSYAQEEHYSLVDHFQTDGLFALTVSPLPIREKLLKLLYDADSNHNQILFSMVILSYLRSPTVRRWESSRGYPYIERLMAGERLSEKLSFTLLNDALLWLERSENLKKDVTLYYYLFVSINFENRIDEDFYPEVHPPGAIYWITPKQVLQAYKEKVDWLPDLDFLKENQHLMERILAEANCSVQKESDLDWERITILREVANLADNEFLSATKSEEREYYQKLEETLQKRRERIGG
jgi:hypothetical protein